MKQTQNKSEILKQLVLDLHRGGNLQELQDRFKQELGDISALEISKMEQELVDTGQLTTTQITKLCDLHVAIVEHSLKAHQDPETIPGHPVHTYMQENHVAKHIIKEIRQNPSHDLVTKLSDIIIHYTRLENQLFPQLEKKSFTGPSSVMWAKHDEIRALFSQGTKIDPLQIAAAVEDLIFKEEKILFPTALEKLSSSDWLNVWNGEGEIGYSWVIPGNEWQPVTPETIRIAEEPLMENLIQLNTGKLSMSQINMILTTLPIEFTLINEKDEVVYYSDSKERIFPRSAGVIGRKVQNCHPPKSVHIVNQILNAFKNGTKDIAEFWIQLNSKFIHIRYFALRDNENTYQGTLEVTQDITTIRNLDGERRLLFWKS